MSEAPLEHKGRWSARPRVAALARAIAYLLPVAVSLVVVWLGSRLVRPPAHSLWHYLGWWLSLSATATVAMALVGRLSRRLLPLAALLRLSLVFPDAAPSRFRTALRSGTVQTLEERLADARRLDTNLTATEAAQRLLVLVAALDSHDRLTRGHSERVRAYSQMIGRELGLKRHDLERLNWVALLHDVGKLEVPTEILGKKGRPTEEEWAILKRHPELGSRLVAPLREWLGEWCDAVGDHHEHWNGGGYPNGAAGSDISFPGRIVAVADVFDVITSSRSYKRASPFSAGRAEIARCAGTQFDPGVVRAFLAISLERRFVAGPLAWLAQAPLLARIPLTSAAGTFSAAAVAVGAAASPGLGMHDHTPARAQVSPPVRTSPAPRTAGHVLIAAPVAGRATGARQHGGTARISAATRSTPITISPPSERPTGRAPARDAPHPTATSAPVPGGPTASAPTEQAAPPATRPVTTPVATTPVVTTPAVTTPTVTTPVVTTPPVTTPPVTTPVVTVPAVTVPAVTVPAVTVPAATVPAILPALPSLPHPK